MKVARNPAPRSPHVLNETVSAPPEEMIGPLGLEVRVLNKDEVVELGWMLGGNIPRIIITSYFDGTDESFTSLPFTHKLQWNGQRKTIPG